MRHEEELRDLAAQQHGHVSHAQADRIGLRPDELARLVRSSAWTAVTSRVIRLAGAPPARGDRLMAAVLDVDCYAVASHQSAAWWWGLPGFGPRGYHVTTSSSSRRRSAIATVHKVRYFSDRWTTELDGIPIVRPELMILQLAASLDTERVGRALDNAWRDRLLSGTSIDELLVDLGRSGRNGIAVVRQLREQRPGDYQPPASNLERRATDVLAPLGLSLERQVDSGGVGWVGRVDLRDRKLPLIIEVQSEKFHTALLDQEADAKRRDDLEAAGFTFVEVWDHELWYEPEVARTRVRLVLKDLRAKKLG